MNTLSKFLTAAAVAVSTLSMATVAQAENKPVGITGSLSSVTVMHDGASVELRVNKIMPTLLRKTLL